MAVHARRPDTQFQLLEAHQIPQSLISPQVVESGQCEALRNLREAIELYLEPDPEDLKENEGQEVVELTL